MAAPARPSRVVRGIVYVLLSTVLFVTMNVAVKYLRASLPLVELVWARTLGQLVFMILLFAPGRGVRRLFRTRRPRTQALCSGLILCSTAMFFAAIGRVPLADATAVSFTSPVIVAVLSGPLLGEYLALGHWVAIAVGLAGALVVARPTGAGDPYILLAAGNAIFYAIYQVLVRRLGTHDRPETTVTYTALGGAVLLSLLVPFAWQTPHGALQWALLALSGLFGGLGHYCVARALQWAPAAIAAPFSYAQLLEAAALGYLVFGDVPGPAVWTGAVLIIASGLYIAWREVY